MDNSNKRAAMKAGLNAPRAGVARRGALAFNGATLNAPFRKLIFGMLTIAILLATCEGALRILGVAPPPARPPLEFINADFGSGFPIERDDQFFWKITPGGEIPVTREKMNSRGMRGGEPAGGACDLTVMCLGDSNTFGIGVHEDETFARRIERWLSSTGKRVNVYNCGTPGYSIYQMWKVLEARGPELKPDIITIYAGAWNDYMPAIGAADDVLDRSMARWRRMQEISGIRNLKLYRFASGLFMNEPVRGGAESRSRDSVARQFFTKNESPDGPRVPPLLFKNTFHQIAAWAARNGARLVVVTPPLPAATRERTKASAEYYQLVTEAAAQEASGNNLQIAHARESLARPAAEDKIYFFDGVHPAAKGHEVVAAEISKAILQFNAPWRMMLPESPLQIADPAQARTMPVLLISLLRDAQYFKGDPRTNPPVSSGFSDDPSVIVVESPSRIIFENVQIPAQAALILERACRLSSDEKTSMKATIEWRVEVSDGGDPLVFVTSEELEGAAWTPSRRTRIDLARFSGKKVKLQLSVSGNAFRASFGAGEIRPYH